MIFPNDTARDRLIVALDVPSADAARAIVTDLADTVTFYKVGLELFVAAGSAFVRELQDRGKRVFLDLKMDDVGETITRAVREITRNGADLITLHGGAATIRAAIAGRSDSRKPGILSVTLLSSLDERDLTEARLLGPGRPFATLLEYVSWRAELALGAGCDGLIASGRTLADLRKLVGEKAMLVTPGIRPAGATLDDHKRSLTPRDAIAAGSDYLVVGRPIRDAADRKAMAIQIIAEIESALATPA